MDKAIDALALALALALAIVSNDEWNFIKYIQKVHSKVHNRGLARKHRREKNRLVKITIDH